jgi:hypothetical protein
MEETVTLARVVQGELPFTLNLPDGTYHVLLDGRQYPIDILQNRLAVAVSADSMQVGTEESLREQFADRWPSLYKHDLRTIVRHAEQIHLTRTSLPIPTNQQMFEAAQEYLVRRQIPSIVQGVPQPAIDARAREWLDALTPDDMETFIEHTRIRLAVAAAFPHRQVDDICSAINVLIRLYMVTFRDRFVQEINQSMFSGTAFRGLQSSVFCNGQHLDQKRYAGGLFPFILRRPWQEHPEQEVSNFRSRLETAMSPDPVVLLNVRAQSLLLRGAHRSAVIEASAAFDLCLTRKIRAAFLAKGKSDSEIGQILEHQRLDTSAKKILKEATGTSVPELNNTLWEKFLKDRARRGSVAHSEAEPTAAEAYTAVEDMMKLAELVDGLQI